MTNYTKYKKLKKRKNEKNKPLDPSTRKKLEVYLKSINLNVKEVKKIEPDEEKV